MHGWHVWVGLSWLWLSEAVLWIDVCNIQQRSCGLHAGNIGYNDISILVNSNPFFDHDFTLVINPLMGTCTIDNCTGVHPIPGDRTTLMDQRIYFPMNTPLSIRGRNITIQSYYANLPVRFIANDGSVQYRKSSGQGLNTIFIVQQPAVTLIDLEFIGNNSALATNNFISNLSPVIVNGKDASGSTFLRLTSSSGNVATVLFMPSIRYPVNVTNLYMQDIATLSPPSGLSIPGAPLNTAVVINDFYGRNGTIVLSDVTQQAVILGVAGQLKLWAGDLTITGNVYNMTFWTDAAGMMFGCPSNDPVQCNCYTWSDEAIKALAAVGVTAIVLVVLWLIVKCANAAGQHSNEAYDAASEAVSKKEN